MKGFIEIKISDTRNALINVNQIESVFQHQKNVEIFMIGCPKSPWRVNNSYEEIVIKIKQATED